VKRTYRFEEAAARVVCTLEDGVQLDVPVFVGILKHPTAQQLEQLLQDPVVVRKYTLEALKKAPWNMLRQFPRSWLESCMAEAELPPGRRKAVEFMLEP
jgi:hypothetical protein